jgi:hypothetical protein
LFVCSLKTSDAEYQLSKIGYHFSKPFTDRLYQLIESVLDSFDKDVLISSTYNDLNKSHSQIKINAIDELRKTIELRKSEISIKQGKSDLFKISDLVRKGEY